MCSRQSQFWLSFSPVESILHIILFILHVDEDGALQAHVRGDLHGEGGHVELC